MIWRLVGLAIVLLFPACATRSPEWNAANDICREKVRSAEAATRKYHEEMKTGKSSAWIEGFVLGYTEGVYDRCMKERGFSPD